MSISLDSVGQSSWRYSQYKTNAGLLSPTGYKGMGLTWRVLNIYQCWCRLLILANDKTDAFVVIQISVSVISNTLFIFMTSNCSNLIVWDTSFLQLAYKCVADAMVLNLSFFTYACIFHDCLYKSFLLLSVEENTIFQVEVFSVVASRVDQTCGSWQVGLKYASVACALDISVY